MSADPSPANVQTIKAKTYQLIEGVMFRTGKIDAVSKFKTQNGKTKYSTAMLCPSVDKFATPAVIDIFSDSPLGQIGDEWSGMVRPGGYWKAFTHRTPDENGVLNKGRMVRNTLEVVEE